MKCDSLLHGFDVMFSRRRDIAQRLRLVEHTVVSGKQVPRSELSAHEPTRRKQAGVVQRCLMPGALVTGLTQS